MDTINSRIKLLRKEEQLTQKEFANRLYVSQSYLSGIEQENEIPSEKLIKLISLEFGASHEWLTSGIGEMYDEVYENDKEHLANISNKALLKIMNLLNSNSNAEYSHVAYSLSFLANILTLGEQLPSEDNIQYLDSIETLMASLERIFSIFKNSNSEDINNVSKIHIQEIQKNIVESLELIRSNRL